MATCTFWVVIFRLILDKVQHCHGNLDPTRGLSTQEAAKKEKKNGLAVSWAQHGNCCIGWDMAVMCLKSCSKQYIAFEVFFKDGKRRKSAGYENKKEARTCNLMVYFFIFLFSHSYLGDHGQAFLNLT